MGRLYRTRAIHQIQMQKFLPEKHKELAIKTSLQPPSRAHTHTLLKIHKIRTLSAINIDFIFSRNPTLCFSLQCQS